MAAFRWPRRWVPLPNRVESDCTLRIVSYNILGDGEKLAMSAKHDYCARDLRVWGGEEGRWKRLLAELDEYKADVVCLQEARMAQWYSDILPGMTERGYQGTHVLTSLREGDANRVPEEAMGVAMFVKEDVFEPVEFSGNLLRTFLGKDRFSGKTKRKLNMLDDGILIGLLRHKVSRREVVVATAHFFWDPHWPHVKASQAELACLAIRQFTDERKVEDPVILCGDFNSVPHLQPVFLPTLTRESLEILNANGTQLPSHFEASAVYHLLHRGHLPTNHPEHPDGFGKEILLEPKIVEEAKKKKKKNDPSCGPFKSNLVLHSCYEVARGGRTLLLTTKCSDFTGTLDYILSTLPETAVLEVLEMPYEDDTASSFPFIPSAQFPSDHLAMGAVYNLKRTEISSIK